MNNGGHSRFMRRWKTPYERRYDPLCGPNNTLRSRDFVLSHFHERQGQASAIQLTSPPRYFFGCAVNTEGGWTGDLLVADAEGLSNNTASEVHVKKDSKKKRWESQR